MADALGAEHPSAAGAHRGKVGAPRETQRDSAAGADAPWRRRRRRAEVAELRCGSRGTRRWKGRCAVGFHVLRAREATPRRFRPRSSVARSPHNSRAQLYAEAKRQKERLVGAEAAEASPWRRGANAAVPWKPQSTDLKVGASRRHSLRDGGEGSCEPASSGDVRSSRRRRSGAPRFRGAPRGCEVSARTRSPRAPRSTRRRRSATARSAAPCAARESRTSATLDCRHPLETEVREKSKRATPCPVRRGC